jgi:hypothetical protein
MTDLPPPGPTRPPGGPAPEDAAPGTAGSAATGSFRAAPLWLRVGFGLSLALNLAIAGLVVGAAGRDRWDDRRSAAADGGGPHGDAGHVTGRAADRDNPGGMALSPYAAALPPSDRRALGREVIARVRSEGIGLRDLRASVETLVTALRADPYRPEAVAAELARQRAALTRLQEVSQDAVLGRVAQMSAEERRAFADRIEDGLRRRGGPPRD